MPKAFRGSVVCKSYGNKISELRIARAYIRLLLVPEGKDGERAVSLARIGDYEVRIVEVSQSSAADVPPLWMELYAHDVQSAIDSCSCHEFEEAAAAAEHLISQAKGMNELSQRERNEMRH
jgi:hypothetical protein